MTSQGWTPDRGFWRHRSVFVTGATGLLGSHLVGQLVDVKAHVVILVRDRVPLTSIHQRWWNDVSRVDGDVEDCAGLERVLGEYEVDQVFHLAAQTQVGVANANPSSTYATNVGGTWSLLEAVRGSPLVKGVIVASSDKAYGTQPVLPYDEDMPLLAVNPYDVSKACADLITTSYAATFGVPAVVTRCGNFYGPGDTNWSRLVPSVFRDLIDARPPRLRSDGSPVRDYLHVADGAAGYLCAAEAVAGGTATPGRSYNLSTETPLSVLDLVARMQASAGTDLPVEFTNGAGHEIQEQYLNASRARAELGWSPSWDIDTGLADTLSWYRALLAQSCE